MYRFIHQENRQAEIGKLACSIGATAAARKISKFGGTGINESMVCGFKKAYLNELCSKRLREEEDLTVRELSTRLQRVTIYNIANFSFSI